MANSKTVIDNLVRRQVDQHKLDYKKSESKTDLSHYREIARESEKRARLNIEKVQREKENAHKFF